MGQNNTTGDSRDLEEFKKHIQNWVEQRQQERQKGSEEINKHMAQKTQLENSKPRADYNGFSAEQMDKLCNHPLEEGCPVQLRHLTEEEISQIPVMRQALYLMNLLSEKDIKLTTSGFIPPKIVSELCELGTHSWEFDWYKQKTESRVEQIRVLRLVLKEVGLTEINSGRISLSAKGKKLLTNHNLLLRSIILFLFTDYDTGWLDGSDDMVGGNVARLYSLWLLHHFGAQWRPVAFYEEEYQRAFPYLDDVLYTSRVYNRLFGLIGICEVKDESIFFLNHEIRKTTNLDMMFAFEEPGKI